MTTAAPSDGSADGPVPRALVINLPRHSARRKSVAARLDAAGVSFEWAQAVDGPALTASERASQVTRLGRALDVGERPPLAAQAAIGHLLLRLGGPRLAPELGPEMRLGNVLFDGARCAGALRAAGDFPEP